MELYLHFSLLMDRSPGFGSMVTNFMRPVQTRSRCGFGTEYLNLARNYNSPDRSTKSTRSHLNVLPLLVSTRFQVLFHSPPGVLFTFPSRYCSSIGHQVVFRLGWWSTRLPTGFHVPGGTLDPPQKRSAFAYGALTPYGRPSQTFQLAYVPLSVSETPAGKPAGLASSAFARHYWRNLG